MRSNTYTHTHDYQTHAHRCLSLYFEYKYQPNGLFQLKKKIKYIFSVENFSKKFPFQSRSLFFSFLLFLLHNHRMAPPAYADLGKQARDVFNKGYHFGLWKLDCKTRSETGVEFSTSGISNQETGKVAASLETKYRIPEYNLSFSEKWNTDNTLNTEITHSDLLKGLKLTFEGSFAPQTGNKTGKIKVGYGQDNVQVNSDVNLDLAGTVVNASGVVGYEGWLAGYQTAFDAPKGKLITNNFAVSYVNRDIAVHTSV